MRKSPKKNYHYRAYGRAIRTSFPLGLRETRPLISEMDIRSSKNQAPKGKRFHLVRDAKGFPICIFATYRGGFIVRYLGRASFVISRGGKRVVCYPGRLNELDL